MLSETPPQNYDNYVAKARLQTRNARENAAFERGTRSSFTPHCGNQHSRSYPQDED